jgi:chemotaxis protein MotB
METVDSFKRTQGDHAAEEKGKDRSLPLPSKRETPIRKKKRKRRQEEEHENVERWLVSYADFITLLFAFFVTMFAISRVDENKVASAVDSLQRALGFLVPGQVAQAHSGGFPSSRVPFDVNVIAAPQAYQKTSEVEDFENLAKEIQQELERTSGQSSQIKYFIDKGGLIVRVPERLFFNSGDASLRPEVIPILNVLSESLGKIPNLVRIEGHTDNMPINTSRFPSNWELSTSRATTVVRYLLDRHHFDPIKISAVGYGEFRPIAPNTTPEGKLQNRRVDVVILNRREGALEP